MSAGWIVITGWERFQHYHDRNPPWIKNYVALMHDDDYLGLSEHRALMLHRLWLEYASSAARLPADTGSLSRRLGQRVTAADLEALNDAGFITISASKPLAPRYHDASPTRARGETETETERTSPLPPQAGEPSEPEPTTLDATLGEALEQAASDAAPCLICGEPVRPGYRCPGCGSNPRAAGSASRQTSKRRTSSSDYERAVTYTENEGWQYPLDAYRDDLERFDLNASERAQLEQLRDELVDDAEALAW